MSMRANYVKEREGIETVSHEHGYLEYKFNDKEKCLQITDIYVEPSHRQKGVAKEMADKVLEVVKKEKYLGLIGSACLNTKGCEDSMKVLLAYGMIPYAMEPYTMMVYFKKLIEEG